MKEQELVAAPCLVEGPLKISGGALVGAARGLGSARAASVLKAIGIPHAFAQVERVFASDQDPVDGVNRVLQELADFFKAARRFGIVAAERRGAAPGQENPAGVVRTTAEHYGALFRSFSDSAFWKEPLDLLQARLTRNGIDPARFRNCEVLDAGCGGGRYTFAWRALGARRAVGIDVSATGVASARRRLAGSGVEGIEFRRGDVLEMPIPDNAFDVVFSNGILHHTLDWRRGLRELVRVLRPGGLGWVYVIERPGGLFWDVIEILRVVMRGESRALARATLRSLAVPANRIFYMLDHVLVPINLRLAAEEVEEGLAEAGATEIRRLRRGADFDRVERIYRKEPFAASKYGVGENRYLFSKSRGAQARRHA